MNVLVCGGRGFGLSLVERAIVFGALDALHSSQGVEILIHGGAPRADSVAGEWAAERGVLARVFHAQWDKLGKQAGPIRNRQMLERGKPSVVIAFPGGRGTANMVTLAEGAGVPVRRVER